MPAAGYESFGEPLDLEKKIVVDGESELTSQEGSKDPAYGYQGPKVDIKSLNWRKIDGPFASVWLHNVPWGSEDTKAAPDAEVYTLQFSMIFCCNFTASVYCFRIIRKLKCTELWVMTPSLFVNYSAVFRWLFGPDHDEGLSQTAIAQVDDWIG